MSSKLKGIIRSENKIRGVIQEQKAIEVSVTSGARGISTYELWLNEGNIGTKQDFLLSLKGVKGDTGLAGIQGEQGIQGETGAKGDGLDYNTMTPEQIAGLKGDKGDKGDTGERGERGLQGIQGLTGKDGIRGADGTNGKDGVNGTDGARGETGLTGKQGERGFTGEKGSPFAYTDFTLEQLALLKGAKGDRGTDGIDGKQGIQGERGLTGDTGKAGLDGVNGLDGKDGVQGLKGDTGERGLQGLIGLTGADGKQGIQGERGLTGLAGKDGIDGAKGEVGLRGIQGEKGLDGADGKPFLYTDFTVEQLALLKGAKGDKGETGLTGEQGVAGKDGTNGTNGIDGTNGKDGIDGKDGTSSDTRVTADGKFEYFNGTEWVEVKGGSSSAGYSVTKILDLIIKPADMSAELKWKDPIDRMVLDSLGNLVTIAKWKSTKVMRKLGSYPLHEEDGDLVTISGVRNQYQKTAYVDTGLTNGVDYYYSLFPITEDGVVTIDETSRAMVNPYAKLIYPGNQTFLEGDGNETAGYMGYVLQADLITGSELALLCGISQGKPQRETAAWNKFMIDGKIIYKAGASFRVGVSWDVLNNAGCVDGTKIITKNNMKFKVRLMQGVSRFEEGQYDGAVCHGSEWNRIMLPLMSKSKQDAWASPQNVEPSVACWATNQSETGVGVAITYWQSGLKYEDGCWHLCQGALQNPVYRNVRGGEDISNVGVVGSNDTDARWGWSPVLEVVE